MKIETKDFVYLTPPDSHGQLLVIMSKPSTGAPLLVVNVNKPEDIQALQTITKPQ